RWWRVQKRKLLDVTQAKRLHAQDHVGEIAALDFRLRETGPVEIILLGIKPDAHAVAHPSATSLALVRTALRHPLDGQPAGAALRRVPAHARESGIDHKANSRNRQRRLGNVGRHNNFPLLTGSEHALL